MFHQPSGDNRDGFKQPNSPDENRWSNDFQWNDLPPQFAIRPATLKDLPDLQHVAKTTFYTAFKDSCGAADMDEYLLTSFSEEKLTAELTNPLSQYFVITYCSDKIVGYGKLNVSKAQTIESLRAHEDYIQLQRLYIMPEYQSFKLGTKFMSFLLFYSQALGYDKCWLTVWDQNEGAIKFYHRFGFEALEDKVEFVMGNDVTYDYVMVVDLPSLDIPEPESPTN